VEHHPPFIIVGMIDDLVVPPHPPRILYLRERRPFFFDARLFEGFLRCVLVAGLWCLCELCLTVLPNRLERENPNNPII
tara:strand:+ start:872 stop:1108 length:237 start_codon:yes stop_codon:yes gene_type:complete